MPQLKKFTGYQWLLIDVANQWGLDKLRFEERIEWAEDHIEDLELLGETRDKWKEYPLYRKAVMALRKAQQGIATGHMVGLDAVCSGLQIMATLTGCLDGARATGLVDPDRRADAYTEALQLMRKHVPTLPAEERGKVKDAIMTAYYGSKKEPKKLFGEDTPELEAFYKAMYELSPGACELLEHLRNSWQPFALEHSWVLPDNHHCHVKVMKTIKARVEVDELNHHTFTYQYQDNVGSKKGLSNIANVVHSIDAYVMRSLVRRCNYDKPTLWAAKIMLEDDLCGLNPSSKAREIPKEFSDLLDRYNNTGIVDLSIAFYMFHDLMFWMTKEHKVALLQLIHSTVESEPFSIVCVHDEFKCHTNNVDVMRKHYRDIMAELAEGDLLSDIFTQIMGQTCTYHKNTNDLGSYIRSSNYGIC